MKIHLSNPLVLTIGLCFFVLESVMAQSSERAGLPDFDRRAGGAAVVTAGERQGAVSALRAEVAGAGIDFNEVAGGPKWVRSRDGYLSGPGGEGKGISAAVAAGFAADDPHRTAKAFVQEHQALFGYGPEVLVSARIYRDYVTPHNGMKTTLWQQELDGIEVYEAVFAAHTTKAGELIGISSQFLADPAAAAYGGAAAYASRSQPVITAQQAVVAAAGSLEEPVDLAGVKAMGNGATGAEQRQQFSAQPFNQAIEARLVWLPMNAKQMRLSWEVTLTSHARGETFGLLVDAQTGEVQVRRCLTVDLSDATYRVYTSDSPSPFSPGWSTPNSGQPALTSRVLVTWSALDTNASPNGWIDDGVNETRGNNVDAHTDRNADNVPDLPRPQGSPFRVFDCPMDLTQSPTTYTNAAVVQLFYWCNFMHDKLYELGFTEAAGNFQNNNFGRGGLGNDALQADAQDGSGYNNANFTPTADGTPPRIQMYIFNGSTPNRDGDFDAEVVLHEYTHGLSSRLVGGGVGISALQTEGMGEGWSDFYALALLSEAGDDVNGVYACGAYVTYMMSGLTQNYYFGIRRYPYCTDMTKNPLTFKDIDPAQASSHAGIPHSPIIGGSADEVHNQGEVWCMTLREARASLINKYGWAAGNPLILQLVTDGMKLSPANPNFLQARDAILQADWVDTGGANQHELWAAFAKRGMGYSATSPSSSTTVGLHESYDIPDALSVSPTDGFTSSGPVGGPFSPNSITLTLTNTGSSSLSWTLGNSATWLNVTPAGGTLNPGGPSAPVTASLNAPASSLPMGVYTATVWFTNLNDLVGQGRQFTLRVGQPDYYTELFDPTANDMAYKTFTFTPDGSANFYSVCQQPATAFPTDPTGGTLLSLTDDSYSAVTLSGGNTVAIYGTRSGVLYVGSNGYLTMNTGDTAYLESLSAHFSLPRVSGLFDDLNPGAGGTISWQQLSDRAVVTYQNVPEYGTSDVNSFQMELFYDGRIRLTCLEIDATDGLAGLSAGTGVPVNFQESDFSSYNSCGPQPPEIIAQPDNTNVPPGGTANFSVTAAGSAPLGYFWQRNGTAILGATNSSYTTNNVQLTDSGSQFSCLVSNAYDSILSSNATLTVSVPNNPVFLNGNYLYLPINTNGVFIAASTGGKFNSAGTGGAFGIDFWWPGTPVYNYVIGVGGIDYADGNFLSVTVSNLSSGSLQRALIDATVIPGLHFTRDISFAITNKAIRIVDTLQNNGSSTLANLVTLDNTDPDQDYTAFPSTYNTLNDVVSVNLTNDMVVATGPTTGLSLGFGSDSGGQVPSAAGFDNTDAYAYLTVVDPDGASADIAINLAQNYGSLNPGQSKSVVWYMVFDVSKAAVTNAFAALGMTNTPPQIFIQPSSQTALVGSSAAFSVTASGTTPLNYFWRRNGTPIAEANASSYTTNNVQLADSGSQFSCLVSNAYGSVLSSNALLTVVTGAVDLITFDDLTDTASGLQVPTGYHGLTWNNFYELDGFALPDSGYQYGMVSVSNVAFNWFGGSASMTMDSPFTLVSAYLTAAWTPNLQVRVTGYAGSVLTYDQTYTLSTTVPTLVNFNYGGVTEVDFSGLGGSDTTFVMDNVTTTGTPNPPAITLQPTNQTVMVGGTATFTVAATGTTPLNYQWMSNLMYFRGATNTSLTLTNVQLNQAGNYAVLVTNLYGSILSSNAVLTVVSTGSCAPVSSGLVSWWPGEGNANDIVSTNNGVLQGAISFAAGEVGQAFVFDGTSTSVQVPASSNLNVGLGGGFTLETWIKPMDIYGHMVENLFEWNNGSGGIGVHVSVSVVAFGDLYANIIDTAGVYHAIESAGGILATNVLQHMALTYDKTTGVAVLYLNGVAVTITNLGNFTPQTSYDLYFGERPSGPFTGSYFNGLMDEISIYNRALSSNEVASIYNAGSSGKCESLPPPVPVITGFSPISGLAGASATISGTNFSPVLSNNIVYFGAVRAVVTAASVTNLVVTVPVGATYAPITETVNGMTAYANTPFLPTFLGDGSSISPSSFAPRVDLPGGSGPWITAIADLDGDGKPDLVVANAYDGTVSLFRNISTNGPLTINSFAPRVDLSLAVGGSPGGLAVADVDGDGKLDVVVADQNNNQIMIFRNISTVGTLTTSSFAAPVAFSVGSLPGTVCVRDLDGDGRPDIACVCYYETNIYILRNVGMPGGLDTNSFTRQLVGVPRNTAVDLVVADLDGDGKPDMVPIMQGDTVPPMVSVFRNTSVPGAISFASPVGYAAGNESGAIIAGDVDGDGKMDLVIGWASGAAISVYRNLASPGSLDTSSFAPKVDFPAPGWVRGLGMGDLNGDGKPDISLITQSSDLMAVYQNLSTPGSFTNTSLADRVDYAGGDNPHGVAVGDLDGDGRPDIVYGNMFGGYVSIYQNVMPFGGAPVITTQPTNQTVGVGGTASFNVTASGTPPLSYQWRFGGTNLSGATNTTLNLTNVQVSQAGNYTVLVTNLYGSILSSNAVLTVTLDHFAWNPIPSPRFVNTPFAVTLRAQNLTNGVFTNFTGTAILGTTNGIAVTPSVSGNFIQGVWTGAVVISQTASNLVLQADDGLEHFGLANPINVVSLPGLGMLHSGNIALYMWPVGYPGFVLEASGSLAPATWVVVPYAPIQIGDQYLLPLDMTGTNGYYRLWFPGP